MRRGARPAHRSTVYEHLRAFLLHDVLGNLVATLLIAAGGWAAKKTRDRLRARRDRVTLLELGPREERVDGRAVPADSGGGPPVLPSDGSVSTGATVTGSDGVQPIHSL